MNYILQRLVFTFIVVLATGLPAQDLWVKDLPVRSRDCAPSEACVTAGLRVRESTVNGVHRIIVITSLRTNGIDTPVFNPFGRYDIGRPCRVVLTDLNWEYKHTVFEGSSGVSTLRQVANWSILTSGGVVGRTYWTRSANNTKEHDEHEYANLPIVPAGKYFLVMIVSRRALYSLPSHSGNHEILHDQWNDNKWDEPSFRSDPVYIEVDNNGKYHPILPEGESAGFEPLETICRTNDNGTLIITTEFVNPMESWLVAPGMNLHVSLDNPMHVSLLQEDGSQTDRFENLGGISGPAVYRKTSHCVLVPRNGVIGGTEPYSGVLPPGKYLVTSEIDESIYKNKLFVDGKKVTPEGGKWPVAFRSRTTTITVPEKAP